MFELKQLGRSNLILLTQYRRDWQVFTALLHPRLPLLQCHPRYRPSSDLLLRHLRSGPRSQCLSLTNATLPKGPLRAPLLR